MSQVIKGVFWSFGAGAEPQDVCKEAEPHVGADGWHSFTAQTGRRSKMTQNSGFKGPV